MKALVSIEWLNQNLSKPNLIILDASLKNSGHGKEFEKFDGTIPNAIRFDLKNVFLDKTSLFPNTIPKPEKFELECRKLGINKDSEIVVFDNSGIYSSPRVWWLFKVMGHQNIAVLDGGLPAWNEKKLQTVKGYTQNMGTGDFEANFDKSLVVEFKRITENTIKKMFTIVDARSQGRFNGTDKEPREHLRSGSIKNSVNIPYQEVLNDGRYKSKTELNVLFKEKCNNEKDLVFSCGSGMTACIVMLAYQISDGNSLKVYDGSWTEWAERNNLKNDM